MHAEQEVSKRGGREERAETDQEGKRKGKESAAEESGAKEKMVSKPSAGSPSTGAEGAEVTVGVAVPVAGAVAFRPLARLSVAHWPMRAVERGSDVSLLVSVRRERQRAA